MKSFNTSYRAGVKGGVISTAFRVNFFRYIKGHEDIFKAVHHYIKYSFECFNNIKARRLKTNKKMLFI